MPLAGFERRDGELHCEGVSLAALAAQAGTPSYVYSGSAVAANYRAYDEAFASVPHEIHFAVKANSSLGVLALLAREGSGFDIVSGGELYRVIRAGGDPAKVVFSGVGKTADEIDYALRCGIGSFNCESEGELEALERVARARGARPRVALRVNPDIDAATHPYISTGLRDHKFGIGIDDAEAIYRRHAGFPALRFDGVSCHIGSQIFDIQAFADALDKTLALVDRLRAAGVETGHLDLGGGLGIAYHPDETPPEVNDYAARLIAGIKGRRLKLMLEPGRSIVGQAGVLLTRVLYRKEGGGKVFVIVDAAMNDLIRPALYQSHHEILPVVENGGGEILADVVGPVCETGDFLARDRRMADVQPGGLLAIATAGAYGFVLSSNYNSRPRAAETLVEGASWKTIRQRESYPDLVRGESV